MTNSRTSHGPWSGPRPLCSNVPPRPGSRRLLRDPCHVRLLSGSPHEYRWEDESYKQKGRSDRNREIHSEHKRLTRKWR